ncbi:MAG TPA: LysM peptidoglycan-binding domain-containing protein [Firmicutes bacterium]|nr:LysM peptidoglycan-binding domain-containing protein [Bacillota bacterium]
MFFGLLLRQLKTSEHTINYKSYKGGPAMAIYVVQPGDTLWSIARLFGVSEQEIMTASNLTSSEIFPGQELVIIAVEEPTVPTPPTVPAPPGVTVHVVQRGETLFSIARRYGISLDDLVRANPGLVYPGLRLRIPEAAVPVTPPEEKRETECFRLTLSTDRTSYTRGTPVTMKLTKTNTCRRTQTLTYLTGQRYEFEIRQDNRLIWRWSDGRAFSQAVQRIHARPGETMIFTEQWPQVDSAGRRVEPGRYRVVAWNTARELREEVITIYVEIR